MVTVGEVLKDTKEIRVWSHDPARIVACIPYDHGYKVVNYMPSEGRFCVISDLGGRAYVSRLTVSDGSAKVI